MNNEEQTPSPLPKRHRISFDAEPGFELQVRLLAARWGVKTNVAIQRAVELANSKGPQRDDILAFQHMATRMEEVLRHLLPP